MDTDAETSHGIARAPCMAWLFSAFALETKRGIDPSESLRAGVARVHPQTCLHNGLSCACFIDSGKIQGSLM